MHGTKQGSAHTRSGLTRLEIVAIISVVSLFASISLPWILQQRELSRRKQCQDHLKQFGMALHNYHDAYRFFPSAVSIDPAGVAYSATGHCVLIPFFDQDADFEYDRWIPWFSQDRKVAMAVVSVFACPSSSALNPVVNEYIGSSRYPIGDTFATTTYIYCKGVTDAWCRTPSSVPANERGPFDCNYWVRKKDIVDGTSNTIFMGEGTAGSDWRVCRGGGCNESMPTKWNPNAELPPQPWIVGQINSDKDVAAGYLAGSLFGCTRDPPNKNPITDTMQDTSDLDDCRCSLNGGPHSTSNFRSDHGGGAYFLFGDGRVEFIDDNIEIVVYRRMSTIAGERK